LDFVGKEFQALGRNSRRWEGIEGIPVGFCWIFFVGIRWYSLVLLEFVGLDIVFFFIYLLLDFVLLVFGGLLWLFFFSNVGKK